jgi:RNA polymerase sigma-70 factor, ECF subfamily
MSDPVDRLYERLLVLRCQAGDEAAFEELVGRYSPRVRNFLGQMLGDVHGAEDALQEVWFDVFRGVGRLRELGAFVPWLYRIARDRAYKILRRHGLTLRSLEETDVPIAVPEGDEEGERPDLINQSLEQLPYEQREVVLLRFVEQMPYEQIAAAVGCGIGTVRSRLHYAKRALRREMERRKDHDA